MTDILTDEAIQMIARDEVSQASRVVARHASEQTEQAVRSVVMQLNRAGLLASGVRLNHSPGRVQVVRDGRILGTITF